MEAGTALGGSPGRLQGSPSGLFGAPPKPLQSTWCIDATGRTPVTEAAGGRAHTSCLGLGSLRTSPNPLGSPFHAVQGHGVQRLPWEPQPCAAPSHSRPDLSRQGLLAAHPCVSLGPQIRWLQTTGISLSVRRPAVRNPGAGQQPPPRPQGWRVGSPCLSQPLGSRAPLSLWPSPSGLCFLVTRPLFCVCLFRTVSLGLGPP